MKKRIFSLMAMAVLLMFPLTMNAEDGMVLTIAENDGTTHKFALSESPVITYSGGNIIITCGSQVVTTSMQGVSSCTFATETIDTGIDDIRSSESVESQPAFYIRNSRISGLKSGSEVAVYSLDGKVLMRSHADSDGNASLNLQSATSGIYIIKTPTRTIKITK